MYWSKTLLLILILAPGNYTLIVKAENVNEKLVPPSRLQIEILPPFYRTIWAYLAYIISIIILTYYIIHTYHHRLKLQESLKYEKRHIEDIEKLNQAKTTFFHQHIPRVPNTVDTYYRPNGNATASTFFQPQCVQ